MKANKFPKILAVMLAAMIAVGAVSMPVFAADAGGKEIIVNPDGTTTEQKKSTSTTTNEETGNTTVTVTVENKTEGTTADGVTVCLKEETSSSVTRDADGNILKETEFNKGSGTRDWEEAHGEGPGVTVALVPGGGRFGKRKRRGNLC